MTTTPNCAVDCVNGCILGEQCPHLVHLAEARKYIEETSWEQILRTAETYTQGQEPPNLPEPSELLKFIRGEAT